MAKRVENIDYEKAVRFVHDIDESGIRIYDCFSDITGKAELLVKHGTKNLKKIGKERLDLEKTLDSCRELEQSEQVRIGSAFLNNYLSAQRRIKRYEQQVQTSGTQKAGARHLNYIKDYFRNKQLYEGYVDINEEGDVVSCPDDLP